MKNKLSVLIPFKNEGEEVARTCKSVRETAGGSVEIIVLNDNSDDGYDYEHSLAPYNVDYNISKERLGSSLGKQWCVDRCKTPYFLILDAHCRIYTNDWLKKALRVLAKDEDCVYCCAVQYFRSEQDHQSHEQMKAFGGFWDYNPKSILSCGWNLHNLTKNEKSNPPFEIPCILGANYLCSKRWWDYIGGYRGLRYYGREETFISKKSWLCGGKVKCIPSILTGHKERISGHAPYTSYAYEVVHNEMVAAYICLPSEMFDRLSKMWETIHEHKTYNMAKKLFISHINELEVLRKDFLCKKKVTHNEADAFNAEFQRKIGFNYAGLREQIKGTYTKYKSQEHISIPVG